MSCILGLAHPNVALAELARVATAAAKVGSSRLLCALVPPCTPAAPLQLLQLPPTYDPLFLSVTRGEKSGKCSVCGTVPVHPALCLLCGQTVCCFTECCTKGGEGECRQHAQTCGAGVAPFLLIRHCAVFVIMGHKRVSWLNSLYLDAFGEEDQELKRGRTMYLSQPRLQWLRRLVTTHSYSQDSTVLKHCRRHNGEKY